MKSDSNVKKISCDIYNSFSHEHKGNCNLMKKISILIFLISVLVFSSCSDWFEVTSISEIREENQYNSVTGFQQSLTGCYLGMTGDALYGKNLSWCGIEILAHQFYPTTLSGGSLDYRLQTFEYSHSDAVSYVEEIWAKAYNVIVNANNTLAWMEKKVSLMDDINYHIMKGELLAIRAYLHFDLLRLYGYGNWAGRASELNAKATIPYLTGVSKDVAPQLSGAETLQLILQDLEDAAALLKSYDPVTGEKEVSFYEEANIDGYYNDRTLHLNYYAVKALQARIYLWEGSEQAKAKALAAAEEVIAAVGESGIRIEDLSTECYLMPADMISNINTSLAAENLFGLNVASLPAKIIQHIVPGYRDGDRAAMFLVPDDAYTLYENSSSDIRFSQLLSQSSFSTTFGFVPLKVYQGNLSGFFKDKVSMIRLPEVYYIAAECYASGASPDPGKALERLNTIRRLRGLYDDLQGLNADEIKAEIEKEYRKEFLSEGVMFFYYKRTGAGNMPHFDEEPGDGQYVLPYPEFELQSGRIQ